jgi:hypothetical protein
MIASLVLWFACSFEIESPTIQQSSSETSAKQNQQNQPYVAVLPEGITEYPAYVDPGLTITPGKEPLISYSDSFKQWYTYTDSSENDPVKVGFFMGGRCLHFYRAYVADDFDRAGVLVDLQTSFLNDPYRFDHVSRDAQRFLERRSKERMGKVTGVVLNQMIERGVLDGALVGESSLIQAWQEGLPIVAVARMGHADADLPGMIMVSPKGRGYTKASDLLGKVAASRRAGAGDETLFLEYFAQANMTPGMDFIMQSQSNDIHLKKGLSKGTIDASLYHVYGALRHIARGDWELIQPLNWVAPEMPAAYLVFHKDFVAERSEDIQRMLRGLAWRVHYETGLTSEEYNAIRDFGYVLNFEYDGVRLPHTTYPFDIIPRHLVDMQELLIKHKFFEQSIDVSQGLDDDRFHEVLEQERRGSVLLPEIQTVNLGADESNVPIDINTVRSSKGVVDMGLAVDGHTTGGLLQRKLEENKIVTAIVLPVCSQVSTKTYCSERPLELWFNGKQTPIPGQWLSLSPIRRSWEGSATTSSQQTVRGIRWLRYDGTSFEELSEFVAQDNTPVIWLSPFFAPSELVVRVLEELPQVHLSLGTIDRELDLNDESRTLFQSQPFEVLVDRIALPKGGWIAKVEPRYTFSVSDTWLKWVESFPTRFIFASDLGMSIHYETRYYNVVRGFEQFVERLPAESQDLLWYTNAHRLLESSLVEEGVER